MRMSAVARHYNFMPKENSKTQQKRKKWQKTTIDLKFVVKSVKKQI